MSRVGAGQTTDADGAPLLELDGIHKEFPGVVANDHISFSIERGEVHGLLGENGAGKSTLMKIIYGLYQQDEGQVKLDGEPVDIDSPQDAIEHGIGMVHQHFKLVPSRTVAENVILGLREPGGDGRFGFLGKLARRWTIDRDRAERETAAIADQYGIDVDPGAGVWELDVGQQQRVELLKALYREIDLLILDEPTAVLTPTQIDRLFETIESLTDQGLTIIFITHKLKEVKEITDRVTVLREGSVVDTTETDTLTTDEMAEMMVGREVLFGVDRERARAGDPVCEATGLSLHNERGVEVLRGLDLTVNRGEIVGVAGVSGNGQRELSECLAGVRTPDSGSIRIDGTDLSGASPKRFIDRGVAHVPEDRLNHGCAPEETLTHNALLKVYGSEQFDDALGFGMDYGKARAYAEEIVDRFDVRVPGVDTKLSSLSGGNLQKFILGRELAREPELIVANQPTRGVDVGAIEFVHEVLFEQRDDGAGVVYISEDLDELLTVSDRIVVMYEGRIVHSTPNEDLRPEDLGPYMTGATGSEEPDRPQSPRT
jgi:simple sugar transport system ATP-binding protein